MVEGQKTDEESVHGAPAQPTSASISAASASPVKAPPTKNPPGAGETEAETAAQALHPDSEAVARLCSAGTAVFAAQRAEKARASQSGVKAKRARDARETLDILIAGGYRAPGGEWVDLAGALRTAVAASVHFPARTWHRPALKGAAAATEVEVRCGTVLAAAQSLAAASPVPRPGVLNFASARNPGGGFTTGAEAQEESLARSSGIYPCLTKHFDAFFAPNRSARSGAYTHDLIFSPGVPVIRDERGSLLDAPYLVDFVTAAAPNCGVLVRQAGKARGAAEAAEAMEERLRRVLCAFASQGCQGLVLGAWGCGVFGNDPAVVARLFNATLFGEFQGCFHRIAFAVLDPAMARVFGDEFKVDVDGLPAAAARGGEPNRQEFKEKQASRKVARDQS